MSFKHACGAAQALYRILVPRTLTLSRPYHLPSYQARLLRSRTPHLATRAFSTTPSRLAKSRPPEERTQKWDDEITAKVIYLIDPETNRRENEPRTRWDVVRGVDRKTHRLIQLSPDEPNNPDFVPVCKVQSKKEAYEQEKQRKQSQKENKAKSAKMSSVKTLELNWAIDLNDLGHRLEKVAEFLAEGRRVEIVLASKKQGRKATKQECEAVLKKIADCVDSVPKAKELKGLEGKLGGFASLVLQGGAPGG